MITLPLNVKTTNVRLQVFSVCLHVVVSFIVIGHFFVYQQYSKSISIEGSAKAWFIAHQDVSHFVHLVQNQSSQGYCVLPQQYDYWHDANGTQRWENNRCILACAPNQTGLCFSRSDVAFKTSDNSNLFVVTHIQYPAAARNYFVPAVESHRLAFDVDYTIPVLPWYATRHSSMEWIWHSSNSDTYIIIVTRDQRIFRVFNPGSYASLSVSELLHLAGIDLNEADELAGSNFAPTATRAFTRGPVMRLSGAHINLEFDCGTQQLYGHIHTPLTGPKCFLYVRRVPGTWVKALMPSQKGASQRIGHGLLIHYKVVGLHISPDLPSIFLNIAAAIVFFQVPRAIIFITAVYLCGHLSSIYRGLVYRKFSITSEAGAVAMRLLAHEVSFEQLQSQSTHGSTDDFIPQETLLNSLGNILDRRGADLTTAEKQQMLGCCLSELSRDVPQQDTLLPAFKGLCGIVPKRTKHDDTGVNFDEFASACSSADLVSWNNLVRLFNTRRRMSCLEALFVPMSLRTCVAEGANTSNAGGKGARTEMARFSTVRQNIHDLHGNMMQLSCEFDEHRLSMQELKEQMSQLVCQLSKYEQASDQQSQQQRQQEKEVMGQEEYDRHKDQMRELNTEMKDNGAAASSQAVELRFSMLELNNIVKTLRLHLSSLQGQIDTRHQEYQQVQQKHEEAMKKLVASMDAVKEEIATKSPLANGYQASHKSANNEAAHDTTRVYRSDVAYDEGCCPPDAIKSIVDQHMKIITKDLKDQIEFRLAACEREVHRFSSALALKGACAVKICGSPETSRSRERTL